VSVLPGMIPPIIGGCLCGEVRYVCSMAPVWSVNCHCKSCQRLSGSPYVSAFSVPADSFEITGETVEFERTAGTGHVVTTSHCAGCGSRIRAQSAGARHLMNVFASTLDDDSNYMPISNVYLSEAVGWIDPPFAKFNFQKMPRA